MKDLLKAHKEELEKMDEEEYTTEIEILRDFDERCSVCNKGLWYLWGDSRYGLNGKRLSNDIIHHHVNYSKNETIIVCKSCHTTIHKTNKFPELKPIDKTPCEWKAFCSDVFFIPDTILRPTWKDKIKNFEKTSGRKYSERKDGEFRYEHDRRWSLNQ